MTPKVSFLVAVYNVADYIEKCARSLFEQTLEDIEIVFCDDASTDQSLELIKRTLEDYPSRQQQVKFMCHEQNLGLAQNRWTGVKAAQGEYILFVDGDDFVDVEMGETLYAKAVAEQADIVVCDSVKETPNGSILLKMSTNNVNQRDLLLNRGCRHNVWNRLFRRTLLDNSHLVWPKCSMAEDMVVSIVLTALAQKVIYLPEPLYHYNFNPYSLMNQNRCYPHYLQQLENTKILLDFWEEMRLCEQYERGYIITKTNVKNALLPITDKLKYRKLWYSTYPELNKLMFWGSKDHPSSYRNKIWFIAIMLGLYPKFRRILFSKRLRPSEEWRAYIPLK